MKEEKKETGRGIVQVMDQQDRTGEDRRESN